MCCQICNFCSKKCRARCHYLLQINRTLVRTSDWYIWSYSWWMLDHRLISHFLFHQNCSSLFYPLNAMLSRCQCTSAIYKYNLKYHLLPELCCWCCCICNCCPIEGHICFIEFNALVWGKKKHNEVFLWSNDVIDRHDMKESSNTTSYWTFLFRF